MSILCVAYDGGRARIDADAISYYVGIYIHTQRRSNEIPMLFLSGGFAREMAIILISFGHNLPLSFHT